MKKKQDPDKLVEEVVLETVANTKTLIEKGGKYFLIMDLPDLTKTPYVEKLSDEEKTRLAKISELHHTKLAEAIKTLQKDYPTIKFYSVDVYHLFSDIVTNLDFYNQKYNQHFNNADTACWPGGYVYKKQSYSTSTSLSEAEATAAAYIEGKNPCENPDSYIFWDHLHPTTATHSILSQVVIEKLL